MNISSKIYISLLTVCFIAFLIMTSENSSFNLLGFLVFFILVSLSENLSVKLPDSGAISISFGLLFACIILFGPMTAAYAALAGAVTLYDIRQKNSVFKWAFNGSQLGLCALLSGLIYVYFGGPIISLGNGLTLADFPQILLPLLLGAMTFFIANSFFMSICMGLLNSDSILKILKHEFNGLALSSVSTIPLSLALSEMYTISGPSGIILIVVPFMIINMSFQTYMQSHENAASIIRTLTSAIEAKDKYTRQHSERVASYASAIANSMSMPERELVELNYASYLHDIGKMAVQRRVLNKPQKLTDLEFNLMKRHPAVGHRIVNQIEMLKHVAEPILKHHEFINGKGYPLGTTDLPLSARIIAVADAFDAMTSLRPYRQPLSFDQAFSELEKNAGTQFDPVIIQYLKKGLAYEDQDKMKHDKPTASKLQLQLDIAV